MIRRIPIFLFALLAFTGIAGTASAAGLSVTPNTWDVIGLRSTSSGILTGPNMYPVGARVCNTSGSDLDDVSATFVWDSANQYIGLDSGQPATDPIGTLAAGQCTHTYFTVAVEKNTSAWNTTRAYHISVAATGASGETPAGRQLYVEKLIAQSRNSTQAISGPGGCDATLTVCDPPPTNLILGNTYTYKLYAETATAYEQVTSFLTFAGSLFRVEKAVSEYELPAGVSVDGPYADACGWDPEPASADYLSCTGPIPPEFNSTGGKAGGKVVTTYTVKAIGTGSDSLTGLIYDVSGSSYHYNADFGKKTVTVTTGSKAKLEITKVADRPVIPDGGDVTFTLTVKNHGPSPSKNVVVSDTVPQGLSVNSADSPCTVNLQMVECVAGTLAAGETRSYRIYATADPIPPVVSGDDQLEISKVEQQISLQAGETRMAQLSCGPTGYMTDASVRTDHVDQGTGDLDSVEVQRLHSTSEASYDTLLTNHASGQAQAKMFGVCVGRKTTQGNDLSVGPLVSETFQLDQGTHTVNLTCGPDTTPIAPGYEVSGGRSWLLASAPDGADGRKFTLKVGQDDTVATVSMRCISNLTSAGGRLEVTPLSKQIVIAPGAVVSEQLTCPVGYKGVVAGWEYVEGLVPLGNDPQPITRVFRIWNPTGSPLNATLHLLCLNLRTGSGTPPSVLVNTASVTSTTPQEPGAVLSDSATVTVGGANSSPTTPVTDTPAPVAGPAADSPTGPTVLEASLSGRKLRLKLRSNGKNCKVTIRSPRNFRLGKRKINKNKLLGTGHSHGQGLTTIKLNRSGAKAIRSGRLRKVRVVVKTGGSKRSSLVRVQR